MKRILTNLIDILATFASTTDESLFLEKLKTASITTLTSDNITQIQNLIDKALNTTEQLVLKGQNQETANSALKTIEAVNDFFAASYLKDLYSFSWSDYKAQIKSLTSERNLDERLLLLKKINTEFTSNKPFSDLPLHSRYMIGGFETKENRAALGLGVGLFGSMRGAGKFTNLLGAKKQFLSPVFDAIPQSGPITREQYMHIVEQYKTCLQNAEVDKNLLKPFTRILAMARPDIFVCMTVRNCRLLKALTRKPTLKSDDYEGYWDNYIAEIHSMPWFESSLETPSSDDPIWTNRVALLDMLVYSQPKADGIKKRVEDLIKIINLKPLTPEQAKKAINDFAIQRGGDFSNLAAFHRPLLLTLMQEGLTTDKAFEVGNLVQQGFSVDDAKEIVFDFDAET